MNDGHAPVEGGARRSYEKRRRVESSRLQVGEIRVKSQWLRQESGREIVTILMLE